MKTMPKSTVEEKLRWIQPILDKEISIKSMVKVCPFSERSLKHWLSNFKEFGIDIPVAIVGVPVGVHGPQ